MTVYHLYVVLLLLFLLACAPRLIKVEPKGVYHTVKPGETLWRICRTYGVSLEEVVRLNGLEDPTKIQVGQKIFIPGAEEVLDVVLPPPPRISEEAPLFLWPVLGKISRGFSEGEGKHCGIDILAPLGTPVRAAMEGRVTFSGVLRGYGNVVVLEHPGGFYTVYAHNLVNLVREGQWVERGEVIARVGRTGNATTPHLHFEIRNGARAIDPMKMLGTMTAY